MDKGGAGLWKPLLAIAGAGLLRQLTAPFTATSSNDVLVSAKMSRTLNRLRPGVGVVASACSLCAEEALYRFEVVIPARGKAIEARAKIRNVSTSASTFSSGVVPLSLSVGHHPTTSQPFFSHLIQG